MKIFLFVLFFFLINPNLGNGYVIADDDSLKNETHLLLTSKRTSVTGVYINEFMASNSNIDLPGHLGHDDWIELRNTNNYDVDISGFYITDDLSKPTKQRLPTAPGSIKIPKNGYIIIICSGNSSLGANHIDLGLSASGEEIGLFDPSQNLVDSIVFGEQLPDVSMGRSPSDLNVWKYFKNPTPGNSNNLTDSYSMILPPPIFSQKGGVFVNNQNIVLTPPAGFEDAIIYYTLDGSEPDINNIGGKTYNYHDYLGNYKTDQINTYLYSGSLVIADRTNENNRTSLKRSSRYINYNYAPYNYKVSKGTVVKAIAYIPGALSLSRSESFFVFDVLNRYSFPIISISMDEDKLFSYDYGLYTTGQFSDGDGWCAQANYMKEWRYPGNFETFLGGEQKVNKNVDYRIHGGCSRTLPQKSLKVYSSDNFEYPFFENRPERIHENIILRNGGNYWEYNLMKDAINQDVMRGMNIEIQENLPSVVFINGEYWGIHNMREKYDDNYLYVVYGIPKDSVDLIKIQGVPKVKEGDINAYNSMMNFVSVNQHNLKSSSILYDSLINNYIDISSFIDYYIAETYIGNYDWPHNNTRLWRKKVSRVNSENYGPEDGKWRWMLFDTEITHNSHSENSLNALKDNTHENTLTFRNVKDNPKFKESFCVRYADLLNTNFKPNRTLDIVEDYADKYAPEVQEHISRWKTPSISTWNSEIQDYKNFYLLRVNSIKDHLNKLYNYTLGDMKKITVDVSDKNHGFIKVNTVDVLPTTSGINNDAYPWSGDYYENLTTTLSARVYKGYKFSHWLKDGAFYSSNATISFNINSNQTYIAVFEEKLLSDNPYPLAETLDECGYSFKSWSATSPAGVYPGNMSFVYFLKTDPNREDHTLQDTLGGLYNMDYNQSSKSRINGLGNDGVSFINTSSLQGVDNGTLGGAILALNTINQDSVYISWTGGTISKNTRKYSIRLQYRVGDILDFKDLLDENGAVIEYETNEVNGHSMVFENIALPADALNKPYVQLLWRYYYPGSGTKDSRSQLRLDDIEIKTVKHFQSNNLQTAVNASYGEINSKATIKKPGVTTYSASKSVTLEPGFNTENQAGFKAVIKTCN